jgi:hypothetical protein
MIETGNRCRYCNTTGTGIFCNNCGQKFNAERLSLHSIFHEAFHFFTHLDHGFPYTLKKLLTAPGKMQKEYIEGFRQKYQKPFAMFFLCATIAALAIYWINLLLIDHFNAGDTREAMFFHKYWVILQVFMLPFYSLVTYLFFKRSGLNYGEIMVFQLYLFSFLFIMLAVIHLFKFISPHLQTRYIELPLIVIYTGITNFNFFKSLKKPLIIAFTILSIGICFLFASYIQDLLVVMF